MTVVDAGQTTHPGCDPSALSQHDANGLHRVLLTLGASGLAGAVVTGEPDEDAALWLGRLWGRRSGVAVVEIDGRRMAYQWPTDWQRLVEDSATWPDHATAEVGRDLYAVAPAHGEALTSPVRWLA